MKILAKDVKIVDRETRWYKGRDKVEVIAFMPKVRKALVRAVEAIEIDDDHEILIGERFVTMTRLLWRKPASEHTI